MSAHSSAQEHNPWFGPHCSSASDVVENTGEARIFVGWIFFLDQVYTREKS